MFESSSNNIIQFPNNKTYNSIDVSDINKVSDLKENLEDARIAYALDATDDCMDMLMSSLSNYGFFNKAEKTHQKDIVAIHEIIHSSLCRYIGVHHNLQDTVDLLIQEEDEIK